MKKIIFILFLNIFFVQFSYSISPDYIWSTHLLSPEYEVKPGDQIIFRVTLINRENRDWKEGEYSLKAEIFNEKKLFLTETSPAVGKEKLSSEQMTSLDIIFNIPQNYKGLYFYRIALYKEGKILYRSDYYFFNVVGKESIEEKEEEKILEEKRITEKTEKEKEKTYQLTGNYNLNYQTSSYKKQNYVYYYLLTELKTSKYSSKFSLSTSYTNNKFNFDRYLLEYRSENFSTALGDSFLNISNSRINYITSLLSGCGIEGIQLNYKKGRYYWTIWTGENISAKDENFSGINLSCEIKNNTTLGFSYLLIEDEEKKSKISRAFFSHSPFKNIFLNLEGAISDNAKNANYYSLEAIGVREKIYFTINKKWVEKEFAKIGTSKINEGEEFLLNYQITPYLFTSFNLNKYKEYQSLLAEEPVIYKRISVDTSWSIPSFLRIRFGYEETKEESNDIFSPRDLNSKLWTIGSDTTIKNFFTSLNFQKREEIDKILENSSKGNSIYFNLRGEIIPNLPFSFSYNYQKEKKSEINQKYLTNILTFNLEYQFLQEKLKKLKLKLYTSIYSLKNPANSETYSYNFSLNYKMTEKINFELGGGQEFYKNSFKYTKNILFLKHTLRF